MPDFPQGLRDKGGWSMQQYGLCKSRMMLITHKVTFHLILECIFKMNRDSNSGLVDMVPKTIQSLNLSKCSGSIFFIY